MANNFIKFPYKNKNSRSDGFSLIEVIITISLFLLMAGAGVGAYFQYYQSSLAHSDVDNVLTLIKQTRFKALKNPTNSDYGVRIDSVTRSFTSFRETYVPNAPENVVLELDQLNILNLNLDPDIGVTKDIVFEKQTGKTQNTGAFTIGSNSFTYTFTINLQGVVN